MVSPSVSTCSGLYAFGQLSKTCGIPSPSGSMLCDSASPSFRPPQSESFSSREPSPSLSSPSPQAGGSCTTQPSKRRGVRVNEYPTMVRPSSETSVAMLSCHGSTPIPCATRYSRILMTPSPAVHRNASSSVLYSTDMDPTIIAPFCEIARAVPSIPTGIWSSRLMRDPGVQTTGSIRGSPPLPTIKFPVEETPSTREFSNPSESGSRLVPSPAR